MKNLNALFAMSLVVALSGAVPSVRAELVKQDISQDSIVPEESDSSITSDQTAPEEVVVERRVVKKAPRRQAPRRVVIQEVQAQEEEVVAAAPAAKQSDTVGSAVDAAIDNKMNTAKQKLADALVKALDNIQIRVGEDAQAQAAAAPVAPVVTEVAPAAPATPTLVRDSLVNRAAAPAENNTYADLDSDGVSSAPTSVAKEESDSDEIKGKIGVFPMAGYTSISSDQYNIDSRSSMGVGIEVDIGQGFRFVGTYMYNQYDVGLGLANPYLAYYGSSYLNNNNQQKLEYNQNVVDAGMRYYLLPKSSRFQFFIGSSVGVNKGYLNYRQNTLNTFASNQYYVTNGQLDDYEVTSYLGSVETGGDIRVSKNVSVGGAFKYSSVLSSNENKPLNNNGFVVNGMGQSGLNQKSVVGGSISSNGFYSILGNLKVAF